MCLNGKIICYEEITILDFRREIKVTKFLKSYFHESIFIFPGFQGSIILVVFVQLINIEPKS